MGDNLRAYCWQVGHRLKSRLSSSPQARQSLWVCAKRVTRCAQVAKAELIGHDPSTTLLNVVASVSLPRPATDSFVKAASRNFITHGAINAQCRHGKTLDDIGAARR